MFRNRETGRITIAQLPNIRLGVVALAWVVRALLRPDGAARTAVDVVGTGAALWWAGDEVVRGVNPWRRLLGAGVLAIVIAGLVA
jgi:hypothetical protein